MALPEVKLVNEFLENEDVKTDIMETSSLPDHDYHKSMDNCVVSSYASNNDVFKVVTMDWQAEEDPISIAKTIAKRRVESRNKMPPANMQIFSYKTNPKRKPVPLKIRITKNEKNEAEGQIQCPLCSGCYDTYLKFVSHLSCCHYKEELINCYGSDDKNWICSICGKKIAKDAKGPRLLHHIGTVHEHVLNVAHKAVKVQLDDLRAFGQIYKVNEVVWSRCKTHFLKSVKKQTCCHNFMTGPQQLRFHLASTHYKGDLITKYGAIGKPCTLCKIDRQYVAGSEKDIILHLITSHSQSLYTLMPVYDAKMLSRCLKIDTNNKSLFIPNGYNCPVCNLPHDIPNLLRSHLSTVHFRLELLRVANVKDIRKCPICEQSIGKKTTIRSECTTLMSKHIGCKHGFLKQVLPGEVKDALEIIENRGAQQVTQLKDEKIKKLSISFSKNSVKCPLCEHPFRSTNAIKSHLAKCHFQKEVLSIAGVNDICNQCPLCGKHMYSNSSRDNGGMTIHIGITHKYLDQVMPLEMKKELNHQFEIKFPQSTQFDLPEAESQITETKDTSEKNKINEVMIVPDKHISCMLCEAKFHRYYLLRNHLILVHYKVEVLKKAGATDPRKCNICGKNMGGVKTNNFPSLLVGHMAEHVGNRHKILEEVMPPDVRDKLESIRMSKNAGKRGRKPKPKGCVEPVDPLLI